MKKVSWFLLALITLVGCSKQSKFTESVELIEKDGESRVVTSISNKEKTESINAVFYDYDMIDGKVSKENKTIQYGLKEINETTASGFIITDSANNYVTSIVRLDLGGKDESACGRNRKLDGTALYSNGLLGDENCSEEERELLDFLENRFVAFKEEIEMNEKDLLAKFIEMRNGYKGN